MIYRRLYGGDCEKALYTLNSGVVVRHLTNTQASGYWKVDGNWLSVYLTDNEPYHDVVFNSSYEGLGQAVDTTTDRVCMFDISECLPDGTIPGSNWVKSVWARVVYNDGCEKGDFVELLEQRS